MRITDHDNIPHTPHCNVASALKIHMSETTHAALLRMENDYIMTHRGEIEVKVRQHRVYITTAKVRDYTHKLEIALPCEVKHCGHTS